MGAIIIIIICHYIAFLIGFILADKIYNFIKDRENKKRNERMALLYKNSKRIDETGHAYQNLNSKTEIMVDLNDILLKKKIKMI